MRTLVVAVVVLVVALAPTAARADYSVNVAGTCARFARLADALAVGQSPIYVHGANIEPTSNTIAGDMTLTSGNQPCMSGAGGSIALAANVMTRVLLVAAGTATDKTELTLDNVVVSGGNIVGDGGTIYLEHDTSLLVVDGAVVRDGVASGRGGCIYADRSKIIMTAGTSVDSCEAGSDGGGVAIFQTNNDGGYHVLHGLLSNTAVATGGGTWIDGAKVCMFEATHNSAGTDGGAAYATSSDGEAWLGTFATQTFNVAQRDGGSVFVTGDAATLDDASQMISNSAIAKGGGIRATDSAVVGLVPGSVLRSNNAQSDGGGIHGDGLAAISLSGVYDPIAVGDGELHGFCGDSAGSVVLDSNLAGYDAAGTQVSPSRSGGGIYLSNATLDGNTASFTSNKASFSGGGIGAYAGASIDIDYVTFTTNIASLANGGGLLANATLVLDLDHATFTGNTAKLGGGGVGVIGAATGKLTNTTLTSNQAFAGGGLYAGFGSSVTMLTGTISTNTADTGGGVASDASTVTLGDTVDNGCPRFRACVTMQANTATGLIGRGGAGVLMSAGALLQVRRSVVVGNHADAGGAFWMERSDHTLYLHNSAIVDNHGNVGNVSAIVAQAGTLGMLHDTVAHNDTGIKLGATTATTLHNSLVIQNAVTDINLTSGATVSGNCNGVQSAGTQAAIVGTSNVTTSAATASVSAALGSPINIGDIRNKCTVLLTLDLPGNPRPNGPSADRGAYEVQ